MILPEKRISPAVDPSQMKQLRAEVVELRGDVKKSAGQFAKIAAENEKLGKENKELKLPSGRRTLWSAGKSANGNFTTQNPTGKLVSLQDNFRCVMLATLGLLVVRMDGDVSGLA